MPEFSPPATDAHNASQLGAMATPPRLSLQSPIVEVVVAAGASMGRSAAAMAPFVARLRADWIDTCGDLRELSKDRDAWAALDIPAKLKLKLKQLAAEAGPGTASQGTPRSHLNPCADEERNPSPTRGSSHGAMPLSPGMPAATAPGAAPSAVLARGEGRMQRIRRMRRLMAVGSPRRTPRRAVHTTTTV